MENNYSAAFDQKEEVVIKQNFIDKVIYKFKNLKIHEWFCFVGILMFLITIAFTSHSFVEQVQSNSAWKVFFGIFDRFTYQSNWLLLIFCLTYFLFPKHQVFKGNKFIISTMVYIFFTFIGYNVVLVGISGDRGYTGDALAVIKNAWLHIICPLYFILFGFIYMIDNKNQQPTLYWKLLLSGMIYPTIYAIYLVSIPFVFTNAPETNSLGTKVYTIYGSATLTNGNPKSWAYIGVMYFLFFPGSFALFYCSWKLINKTRFEFKTYKD